MVQMAMTQNFVRLATEDTEGDYLEFKQREEEKVIKADKLEEFKYTVLNGYHGFTLAFQTKGIYDIYRVFDKEGNIILETEDVVVELPNRITDPDELEIRAYDRLGDDRVIQLGISEESGFFIPLRKASEHYKLSVVVPCYKAELFMCRTIDSILSNSLDNIELIIVNDGSPENDLEIAKRYADSYSCVKVIDKPNTGLCDTRNKGLELCSGEYMAFCDADDIIHPYMYEILYNACKKNNTEIAISNALIREDFNKKVWNFKIKKSVVYTFEEMMQKKDTNDNIYFVGVWNKIVKTDTAKKVRFMTDYIGRSFVYEDIAYTGSLYSYIEKFSYCDDAIYTRDKRKRQTVGTVSTWHKEGDTVEYSWETFIAGASYPLYHKSGKHLEWHDFIHFKRIIEAYKKFQAPCPIRNYFDLKLHEIINSQKLYDNKLIMEDSELSKIVNNLK